MAALTSLITLFAFLAAGILLAGIRPVRQSRIVAKFSTWVLYGLLFFMGFRIAAGSGASLLLEIGKLSLVFAVSTVAGTIAVLIIIYSLVRRFSRVAVNAVETEYRAAETRGAPSAPAGLPLREPLTLFAIVAGGFLAGWLVKIPGFTGEELSAWMLRLLLLAVGIDLKKSGVNLKASLAHAETIYLPLGVIAGSLLGSLVPALLFDIAPGKAAAVASGFGWYSLSGVLITDMGDPVLGSAAFVSNILRETIALLTIPLISRTRFPNIGIGVAGATSMDVTLPLVERCCGADEVPLSIASGAGLSLLVPVLVPLFFQL